MTTSDAFPRTHDEIDNDHGNTTMDRILECAVTLNWNELAMTNAANALHVEYRSEPGLPLDYLKIWSSATRGVWKLVCEYWMQSSSGHESGTTFNGGSYSGDFTWMLDAIMQHQRAFLPGSSAFGDRLVQINQPTAADVTSARADMNEALQRVGTQVGPALPKG